MPQEEVGIVSLFRRIYQALESLPEDELKKLYDPLYTVEVRAVRRRAKEDSTLIPTDASVEEIISKISALSTRQEAQSFLDARCPARKSLEPIARKLDIPIAKQDKVEILRDKIIEATVGARIRSQTIQGTGI